jgi:hypothetical protein
MEGNRPLGRPRHRFKNNIKINFKDIRLEGINWILPAQHVGKWEGLVNMVINLQVLQNVGNLCKDPLASQNGSYSMKLA